MDLGKAFSFVFEDDNWVATILLGGLILLIPIIGQFWLLGMIVQTARNVMQGIDRPMPDLSDFGGKLGMGFWSFIIALVYASPIIILSFLFACVAALSSGMAGSNEEAAGIIIVLASFCFVMLVFVLALVLQPLVIVATARYTQTGNIGDALRFGEVWGIMRNDLGTWLTLWLVQILCGLLASVVSFTVILAPFAYVYSQFVFGHTMGQIIRKTGGTPVAAYDAGATPPPTYQ